MRIDLEVERAGRPSGPLQGHRVGPVGERRRIEASENLTAEIAVPGDAVSIDDHVVRLRFLTWQVVGGDDDPRAGAAHPRQRLEVVRLRVGAAIDGGEERGGPAPDGICSGRWGVSARSHRSCDSRSW